MSTKQLISCLVAVIRASSCSDHAVINVHNNNREGRSFSFDENGLVDLALLESKLGYQDFD